MIDLTLAIRRLARRLARNTAGIGAVLLMAWQGAAFAQTVTLQPDSVTVAGFGSAEITLLVSEAAPVGGWQLSIAVSPVDSLVVPASITIPQGATSTSFNVTAAVDRGVATLVVTLGAATATATVYIGDQAQTCADLVTRAANAAASSQFQVKAIEPACRERGAGCLQSIADAARQLQVQARALKDAARTCRTGGG